MENQHNFESLRNQIRDRENQRAAIVNQYEAALAKIDQGIVRLKVELADLILSGQAATKEDGNLITLVGIKFNEGGKVYDYLWESDEAVEVDDLVEIECRAGGYLTVTAVEVKRMERDAVKWENYKKARPVYVK